MLRCSQNRAHAVVSLGANEFNTVVDTDAEPLTVTQSHHFCSTALDRMTPHAVMITHAACVVGFTDDELCGCHLDPLLFRG